MADQTAQRRKRRSDGEQTYATILDAAVRLVSIEGMSALSIGRLADEAGVSKSGLYAHFGSKEQLQRDIFNAAREIFASEVVGPALAAPEGLPQLEQLCESYLSYVERRVFPGGCFFAGMLAEYDAQSGSTHAEVADDQREWLGLVESLAQRAQDEGHLDRGADLPQLVFDLTAAVELANYHHVLFEDPAVIARARNSIRVAISRAATPGSHPARRRTAARGRAR